MSPRGEATISDWGELRFLRWIRGLAGDSSPEIPLSIGDDAAHLRLPARDLIVTTDALIEGVHFRRDWISPRDLGAKSLAANLSDLAAMAARPVAAFLSIGVPPETPVADLQFFFRGFVREGRRYACPLAGGDLVRAPQWTINVMAVGAPAVPGRVIRRSGARPGQTLYITGQPGDSGAGIEALRRGDAEPALIRRHIRPTPRLLESAILAGTRAGRPCHAMIDVSDGVANDAGHLARESDVGIEIRLASLPVSRPMRRYAEKIGRDALNWVLYGGEDYELLFTTSQPFEEIRREFDRAGIRTRVTAIGRVVQGAGVFLIDPAGKRLRPADRTFKHFA